MASCRTCLGPLDLPVNLFESTYKDLLDVLHRLLSFQVYLDGGEFKVCWHCQGKLMWVSEFQDVCLKSVKSLRLIDVKPRNNITATDITQCNYDIDVKSEHSNNADDDNDYESYNEAIDSLQPIEVRLTRCPRIEELVSPKQKNPSNETVALDCCDEDPFLQQIDQSMSSYFSDSESDSDYLSENATDTKRDNKTKVDKTPDSSPLSKKYAESDCSDSHGGSIIDSDSDYNPARCFRQKRNSKTRHNPPKKVKLNLAEFQLAKKEMCDPNRLLRNMRCCFCKFKAKTSIGIRQHMTRLHKDVNNWCIYCNVKADDMEIHRSVSKCNLWRCSICANVYKGIKNLKIHLKRHLQRHVESPPVKLNAAKVSPIGPMSRISTPVVDKSKKIAIEAGNADFSGEKSVLFVSNDKMIYNGETKNRFNIKNGLNINKHTIVTEELEVNPDCFILKNTSTNSLVADELSLNTEIDDTNSKSLQITSSASKPFEQYPTLAVHEAIASLKRFFNASTYCQCMFCGYIGRHSELLREHMLATHKDKYFDWCEHCNVLTNSLRKHREKTRCYHFLCKFCNIAINNARDLIVHMYSHGNFEDTTKTDFVKSGKLYYRQYPENQVKQAIKDYSDFKTRKRYQCLHCSFLAVYNSLLTKHMRTLHKSQFDDWCKKCNLNTHDLKQHLKTTLCIPRKCSFCEKVYKKDRLINHLRLHCHGKTMLKMQKAQDNGTVDIQILNAK